MNNNKINILGWMLFIVSAVGFIISSIGNVWAMFGSVLFLNSLHSFLIPYFRKNKE